MRELIPFIKSLYFLNFLNEFNQIKTINYTILHFYVYTWLGVDVWLNLGRVQSYAL